MKLIIENWREFIEDEDEVNIQDVLQEGGAMQLIGQYNIQYITEDKEVITALDVIKRYVEKRANYTYGIEEYKRLLEIINEGVGLMESVIDTKREEERSRHGLRPRGAIKDKADKSEDNPFSWE